MIDDVLHRYCLNPKCSHLNPRADHEFIYVQRARRSQSDFPHIRQRLYDVRTSPGCHVTLEVRVRGYPDDCQASWTLDDKPLARREVDNVDFRKGGPGLFRLFIRSAVTANTGLYACTVRNRAGTARTTAFVSVQATGAEKYAPAAKPVPRPLDYSNHTWW